MPNKKYFGHNFKLMKENILNSLFVSKYILLKNVILSVYLENQDGIEYLFLNLILVFLYEGKSLCPVVRLLSLILWVQTLSTSLLVGIRLHPSTLSKPHKVGTSCIGFPFKFCLFISQLWYERTLGNINGVGSID